jgi:hypothetical protein
MSKAERGYRARLAGEIESRFGDEATETWLVIWECEVRPSDSLDEQNRHFWKCENY